MNSIESTIDDIFASLTISIDESDNIKDFNKKLNLRSLIKKHIHTIAKFSKNRKYLKPDNLESTLLDFINYLKNKIIKFIQHLSEQINSNPDIEIQYLYFFNQINTYIQTVKIIFHDIFEDLDIYQNKNKNKNNNGIKLSKNADYISNIFYKYWFNIIYLKNSFRINNIICEKINYIRLLFLEDRFFDKIIQSNFNNNHNILHNLHSLFSEDIVDRVKGVQYIDIIDDYISSIKVLDKFMKDTKCIHYFTNIYQTCMSNLYNYFNTNINLIDQTQEQVKYINKMLIVEIFINNNIFDDYYYNTKFIDKVVTPNLSLYDKTFEEGLSRFNNDNINTLINFILSKNILEFDAIFNCSYILRTISIINQNKTDLNSDFKNIIFKHLLKLYNNYLNSEIVTDSKDIHRKNIDCFKQYLTIHILYNTLFNDNNLELLTNIIHNIDEGIEYTKITHDLLNTNSENLVELIMYICTTDTSIFVVDSSNLNYISNFLKNITNVDELEIKLTDKICKDIVKQSLYSNINCGVLQQLSNSVSNINLKTNYKIVDDVFQNKTLENEFNTIFKDSHNLSLDLSLFPSGIVPIKSNIINPEYYLSKSFSSYISNLKTNFSAYYNSKCNKKLLNFCDNISSLDFEIEYNDNILTIRCRYNQADIIWLLQNEYTNLVEEYLSTDSISTDSISKSIQSYNNVFSKLKCINFLKDKKFIKIKDYGDLQYYYINSKLKLKRDKFVDFTKMKEVSSEQLNKLFNSNIDKNNINMNLSPETDSLEEMTHTLKSKLIFERKDYISSIIMKICKKNKERSLDRDELFTISKECLKTKFEVNNKDFQKTVDYLIDAEYIEQVDTEKYKYII